jgi:succinate dehydrogenase hydrophobic anchor subunit
MLSATAGRFGGHGRRLRVIKVLHTVIWAFFASTIVAIPIAAWQGAFGWVGVLASITMIEVAVLAFNGMRCPLTDIAARFTEDRRANFDIYLPLWLAAHNKQLFGALYIAGLLFALALWVRH